MELESAYPTPKFMKNQLFGYVFGFLPALTKNYPRFYHFRIDMFNQASVRKGEKVDTIQITTFPFMMNGLTTRDPKMVKFMLKDEFDSIRKATFVTQNIRDFLGNGIFALDHGSTSKKDNEMWNFQRKTASKIFTRKIFTGHVYNTLLKNTDSFISIINKNLAHKDHGVVEFKKLFYAFTLDAIGNIGFGEDLKTLGAETEVSFSKAFDIIVASTSLRSIKPWWRIFGRLLKSERDLFHSKKILDSFAFDLVEKRRKDPKLSEKGDILSLFMKADKNLSNVFLRDIIMSFMIAGRDTSACTLSFLFYLLATHQKVQQKLINEIDNCFKKFGITTRATLEMLTELPYLAAVVLEVLRLFPPVPINVKESGRETTLPNGMIAPKNTIFGYEVFVMGRDHEKYPKPGTFDPERWLKKDKFPSFDQYEMPVFQAGNRFCLGKDLAVYEIKILTIELLRRYRFEWPTTFKIDELDVSFLDDKITYATGLTLTYKGDLELKAIVRS